MKKFVAVSANKCSNANNFNIYEQDKFHAKPSWAWKKYHSLGACIETVCKGY